MAARFVVRRCEDGDVLGGNRRPVSWDVFDRQLARVVANYDTRARAKEAATAWLIDSINAAVRERSLTTEST